MKRRQLALLGFWGFLFAASAWVGAVATEAQKRLSLLNPAIAAPTTAYSDGRQPTRLDAFRGQTVVLNIWATWCGPCLKEMPSLDRLSAKLAGQGIKVVALSEDDGGAAQVKPYLEKLKVTRLTHLYDTEQRAFQDFAIRGLPTTFVISPEGKIIAKLEGAAEWDSKAMVEQIKSLSTPLSKSP
jgi:thiol-disulfide isomerase/thioredoxin